MLRNSLCGVPEVSKGALCMLGVGMDAKGCWGVRGSGKVSTNQPGMSFGLH